jgi:hypothetical protein
MKVLTQSTDKFIQSTNRNIQELKNATMANSRDIQELKSSVANIEGKIGQLANQVGEREKGKFPSQPMPNLKGQLAIGNSSTPTHGQEHVQAITTLRSGKQVDNQVVRPEEEEERAKTSLQERLYQTQSFQMLRIRPRSMFQKLHIQKN